MLMCVRVSRPHVIPSSKALGRSCMATAKTVSRRGRGIRVFYLSGRGVRRGSGAGAATVAALRSCGECHYINHPSRCHMRARRVVSGKKVGKGKGGEGALGRFIMLMRPRDAFALSQEYCSGCGAAVFFT